VYAEPNFFHRDDIMKRWWLAGTWMALIFVLSVGPTGPEVSSFWPNLVHFLEYGILGILLLRAIIYTWNMASAVSSALAIGIAFGYGAAMEIVQLSLPHRGFSTEDMMVNLAGAVAGLVLLKLGMRVKNRR